MLPTLTAHLEVARSRPCSAATIVITTTCGYPAGIVFPLIFVGYTIAGGLAACPLVLALAGPRFAHELPQTLGACLGGGFLAGVMHVPLGTALLVQRMSGCDAHGFTMLLVANYIATAVNPLTLFKQVRDLLRSPHVYPPSMTFADLLCVHPRCKGARTAGARFRGGRGAASSRPDGRPVASRGSKSAVCAAWGRLGLVDDPLWGARIYCDRTQ